MLVNADAIMDKLLQFAKWPTSVKVSVLFLVMLGIAVGVFLLIVAPVLFLILLIVLLVVMAVIIITDYFFITPDSR